MNIEINPTDELNIRLSWPLICGLACRAFVLGLTFEEAVEKAVAERLYQENKRG